MERARTQANNRASNLVVVLVIISGGIIHGCDPPRDTSPPVIGGIDTAGVQDYSAYTESDVDGQPAAYFTLSTLDGDTLTLADLEGQVVILNFWATWCAPCRVEIPDLIEMQAELEDRGVQFVGVSIDDFGREAVVAFAEEAGFNYPIAIGDREISDAYGGVYALPTTVLIDREGIVRRKITGLVSRDMLRPMLEELAGS
jgi:peroxiredoxin